MLNLPRFNEYFVLSLAVGKNDMMIQMVDKPNTTPIGQDRETHQFVIDHLKFAWCISHCSAWLLRYNEYFCC